MNLSVAHNKQEALAEIVDIAKRHHIGADEIAFALDQSTSVQAQSDKQKNVVSRLFSYIGGTLIFSGLCVFVGMFWDDFTPFFRVLITFGTGLGLFIAAVGCAKHPARQALVAPLILASAIFQPAGMFVMFEEYGSGGDFRHAVLIISGVLLFQYVMSFTSVRRELLAWLALLCGGIFFVTAADLLDIADNLIAMALGISYLCIASALNDKLSVRHGGFWQMVGAILLLGSFYDMVEGSMLEVTFPGLCALLIYLSIVVKSRSLLAVSTLGLIFYIGDYAFDMFNNNGLFPLALIAVGGVFMGIGSLAMRLDRKFIRQG